MQTRLKPLNIKRVRRDYPQINYVDDKGVQWIELNRGCKRQCEFCWADPNYKVFDVPEIVSNKVMIIGENILYDPKIKQKLGSMGNAKANKKVVYYGLCNGVDYRLLDDELIKLLKEGRFGRITNKRAWLKGLSIAWDLGRDQEDDVKETIDKLVKVGYSKNLIQVYVLVNWKITYNFCLYKFQKIEDWGVQICDCTWDCTKKLFIPLYWTVKEYKDFRRKSRKHNQKMRFGIDPEVNK